MSTTQQLVTTIKQNLRDCKVEPKDIRTVTEMMVAEHCSYRITLPTSPVEDPAAYFRTHCKIMCMERLAEINEHLVFNLDTACDLVFNLWQIRYRLVYRPDLPSVDRLVKLASASGLIDQKHAEVCQRYPNAHFPRQQLVAPKEA